MTMTAVSLCTVSGLRCYSAFCLQFINTALIVLVVQAGMPEGRPSPLEGTGVLEGQFEEFTTR